MNKLNFKWVKNKSLLVLHESLNDGLKIELNKDLLFHLNPYNYIKECTYKIRYKEVVPISK